MQLQNFRGTLAMLRDYFALLSQCALSAQPCTVTENDCTPAHSKTLTSMELRFIYKVTKGQRMKMVKNVLTLDTLLLMVVTFLNLNFRV